MRPTRSPRGSARPRATCTTASASRSSGRPTGRRPSCGRGRFSRRSRTRRSVRRRCDCSPTGSTFPARRLPASRPRGSFAPSPCRRRRPRLLEAGLQRERDLLAAVVRNPSLVSELAALTPDHFDDPLHRRFRESLVDGTPADEDLVALRAELGARADRDELDERTGKELLLRLHERRLRRELQGADLVRATELQARLAKVHTALAELV